MDTPQQIAIARLLLLVARVTEFSRAELQAVYQEVGRELSDTTSLEEVGRCLLHSGEQLGKGGFFGLKRKQLSEREREKLRRELHRLATPYVPRSEPFEAIYTVWQVAGLWAAYSDFIDARGDDPKWKALDSEERHDDFAMRASFAAALLHATMAGVSAHSFLASKPTGPELLRRYQSFLVEVKKVFSPEVGQLELPAASALFAFEAFRSGAVSWAEHLDLAVILGACFVDWSNHVQVLANG